jgi:hypothetical protein
MVNPEPTGPMVPADRFDREDDREMVRFPFAIGEPGVDLDFKLAGFREVREMTDRFFSL